MRWWQRLKAIMPGILCSRIAYPQSHEAGKHHLTGNWECFSFSRNDSIVWRESGFAEGGAFVCGKPDVVLVFMVKIYSPCRRLKPERVNSWAILRLSACWWQHQQERRFYTKCTRDTRAPAPQNFLLICSVSKSLVVIISEHTTEHRLETWITRPLNTPLSKQESTHQTLFFNHPNPAFWQEQGLICLNFKHKTQWKNNS